MRLQEAPTARRLLVRAAPAALGLVFGLIMIVWAAVAGHDIFITIMGLIVAMVCGAVAGTTIIAGADTLSQTLAGTIAAGEKQNQMGREHANRAMEYRDRLEFALDATETGFWTYDEDIETFEWDDRMRVLWGFGRHGAITRSEFMSSLHPDDAARFTDLVKAAATESGNGQGIELRIKKFDTGAERWIAIRGKRFSTGPSGVLVGTARDITEARRHDEQVHVLMREVTHRSKNLLAIIQAMARQTVTDSLTAADFEVRFSSRLRGLSFSHEILAAQNWRGASLTELAQGHLGTVMEQHGGRVSISGPAIFIRPEAAQNIGLAFNELTSNALRFGALSGSTGSVAIEWNLEADQLGEPRWLHVVWNEYGGSAVEPPRRLGFGHKVMERVVARALDGIASMTFAPTGLQWSLRIPLYHLMIEDGETPIL
jgi:PAS domain S-box-containing protein